MRNSLKMLRYGSCYRFDSNMRWPRNSCQLFQMLPSGLIQSFTSRGLSSSLSRERNPKFVLSDAFTTNADATEVDRMLKERDIALNRRNILGTLRLLYPRPEAAYKFFNWVSEKDCNNLKSSEYNLMLRILGRNGMVNEFWDLFSVMKDKGHEVSVSMGNEKVDMIDKDGTGSDLEKQKALLLLSGNESVAEKISDKVSKIIRNRVWGTDVEEEIRCTELELSSDILKNIIEKLALEPLKALIFFRWVEEMAKHDSITYNAMARVLGREDCIDRFWKIIDEMKNSGHELELETYRKVSERFLNKKMMKEVVDLTEYAMAGEKKPPVHCFTLLLKKIATAKEFDMELFSRVVKLITQCGFMLRDSMLDSVIKSLISVGRLQDCNRIVTEMMNNGLVPAGSMRRKIASLLSRNGENDEANEFVECIQASSIEFDEKASLSLIDGYCESGNLEKACDTFQKLYKKLDASNACHAFDCLVSSYCSKNRGMEMYNLLQEYVNDNQLRPSLKAYKTLAKRLLAEGRCNEAVQLLVLMRRSGYPPFVTPYFDYISKFGSENDAIAFMKATTSRKVPSSSVTLETFRSFFNAGRHDEAQNLLSKCDKFIRNHPDVLTMFASMQQQRDSAILATN